MESRFIGATSNSAKGANAAIFGAPHGTPYRGIDNSVHAGTAAALRQAMAGDGEWLGHWDFDFGGTLLGTGGFTLADLGDLPTVSVDAAGNRQRIEARTRDVLDAGAVPIMIGGDDSVPIPFIAGFADAGPLTILQIDAHIDWREERYGERLGFSSTMRRASEMPHVERIVQAGARGIGSAREAEVRTAEAWGSKLVTARELHAKGIAAALDHIPAGSRCLIALDCDAMDHAVMPAVAYSAPGGLSYTQVIELIGGAAAKAQIVGFDLVEFIPAKDATGHAAFTAARILCNLIGALARRK